MQSGHPLFEDILERDLRGRRTLFLLHQVCHPFGMANIALWVSISTQYDYGYLMGLLFGFDAQRYCNKSFFPKKILA